MKSCLLAYWEGLKEYFSTALSIVVSAMVIAGYPTWKGKIIAFIVWNALFGALVAGIVHSRKKLEEQFGRNRDG